MTPGETRTVISENPNLKGRVKRGEEKSVGSNIFDKYHEIFLSTKPNSATNYVRIFGRQDNLRLYKWIKREYLADHPNLDKWKVYVAKSNGTGKFGETLSTPEIAEPQTGATQTFISFGAFKTRSEAQNLSKYICTKFVRAMLGIEKVTQDNAKKSVWKNVPLQDFTNKSDIDWSKSIAEIDQQLYKKYDLDKKEIDFIETNVKPML